MRAINDLESKLFDALTSGEYSNFAIASTEFEGIEGAVITAIRVCENEDYEMYPVALLLTGEMFKHVFPKLSEPTKDLGEV